MPLTAIALRAFSERSSVGLIDIVYSMYRLLRYIKHRRIEEEVRIIRNLGDVALVDQWACGFYVADIWSCMHTTSQPWLLETARCLVLRGRTQDA